MGIKPYLPNAKILRLGDCVCENSIKKNKNLKKYKSKEEL